MYYGQSDHSHFFYASYEYCERTKAYMLSQVRLQGQDRTLDLEIPVQILEFSQRANWGRPNKALVLYALLVPTPLIRHALYFWRLTGFGISSRLSSRCLQLVPRLLPDGIEFRVPESALFVPRLNNSSEWADIQLCQRLPSCRIWDVPIRTLLLSLKTWFSYTLLAWQLSTMLVSYCLVFGIVRP